MSRSQLKYIDGIRESVAMIDIAYGRLEAACVNHWTVQEHVDPGLTRANSSDLLSQSWLIVDAALRLNRLLMMPGLTSTPAIEAIKRDTSAVEDLRNYIQHLKNEEISGQQSPLWGAFRWVSPDPGQNQFRVTIFFPGPIAAGPLGPPYVAGKTQFKSPVDDVTLAAGGSQVNLTELAESVERFGRRLTQTLATLEVDPGEERTRVEVGLEES